MTPEHPDHLWTAESDAVLVKLHRQGLSARQIAETMGLRTRNQVIGRISRLGLSRSAALTRATRKLHGIEKRVGATKPPKPSPAAKAFNHGTGMPQLSQPKAPQHVVVTGPVEGSLNIRMWDAAFNSRSCCWPTDGLEGDLFCGAVRVPGINYCAGHASKAWRPSQKRGATPPKGDQDRARPAPPEGDGEPKPLDFDKAA
jgi:hypothetical protein